MWCAAGRACRKANEEISCSYLTMSTELCYWLHILAQGHRFGDGDGVSRCSTGTYFIGSQKDER